MCIPIKSVFSVQAIRHSVLPYILFNSRRCYAHSTVLYPSYIYPRLSPYYQLLGLIPLGLHCILHSFPLVVVLLHVTRLFGRSRYGLSIASMYHLHYSSPTGVHSSLLVSTQADECGLRAPSWRDRQLLGVRKSNRRHVLSADSQCTNPLRWCLSS